MTIVLNNRSKELGRQTRRLFVNRELAGEQLAYLLENHDTQGARLVTIPFGGVPVAVPVSRKLELPLDFRFAVKIPLDLDDVRYGIGAVSEQAAVTHDSLVEYLGINAIDLAERTRYAQVTLREKSDALGTSSSTTELDDRPAILIDDGIATGFTALAIAQELRRNGSQRVVVAAPIASQQGYDRLVEHGFEVAALHVSDDPRFLVDNFYWNFDNVTAGQAQAMLEKGMIELDRAPLEGGFNTNVFVMDHVGQTALARIARPNEDLFANIEYEYRSFGFTADGGRVRRRTPQEQHDFSHHAATDGLAVLPPYDLEGEVVTFPFLENVLTLDEFFAATDDRAGTDRIVYDMVQDLRTAHSKGYVYGDRWSKNILIHPNLGLVHIDFDLELSGAVARELEVAQVAYHTLWAGGDKVADTLAQLLGREAGTGWFDLAKTSKYMRGFANFLRDTPVGGQERATEEFIAMLIANSPTVPIPKVVDTPARFAGAHILSGSSSDGFGPATLYAPGPLSIGRWIR